MPHPLPSQLFCVALRKPQCCVCPAFDMPSSGASTWPCCPLETTLPECGPPRWLAMAPGRRVSLSTSLAQVHTASVLSNSPIQVPSHISYCGNHRPLQPILPPAHLPWWKEKYPLPSDFSIFDAPLCCPCPPTTRGGRLRGAVRPSHCHPRGAHAAHHSCCPWFLLQQEEVRTCPTGSQPPSLPQPLA